MSDYDPNTPDEAQNPWRSRFNELATNIINHVVGQHAQQQGGQPPQALPATPQMPTPPAAAPQQGQQLGQTGSPGLNAQNTLMGNPQQQGPPMPTHGETLGGVPQYGASGPKPAAPPAAAPGAPPAAPQQAAPPARPAAPPPQGGPMGGAGGIPQPGAIPPPGAIQQPGSIASPGMAQSGFNQPPQPTSAADAGAFLADIGVKEIDPNYAQMAMAVAGHMDDFKASVYGHQQNYAKDMAQIAHLSADSQFKKEEAERARQQAMATGERTGILAAKLALEKAEARDKEVKDRLSEVTQRLKDARSYKDGHPEEAGSPASKGLNLGLFTVGGSDAVGPSPNYKNAADTETSALSELNKGSGGDEAPKKAPDGNFYVQKGGKYFKVEQ